MHGRIFIPSNLWEAQNGRFIMKPVYSGGGNMVSVGGKILDFRLSRKPKKCTLQGTFRTPKLSLESWILQCFRENFAEYLCDITIRISIIIYSVPQHFSWFRCKLYWVCKKCDRLDKFINILNIWHISHNYLKTGDLTKKQKGEGCPLKTGVSCSDRESWNIWFCM